MMDRYIKNKKMFSQEDMMKLKASRVCVVGCGGLGGYVIEMLLRVGVGSITAIDGDCFDVSNLNRQLLSHEGNMGKYKAQVALERAELVNSENKFTSIIGFLNAENAQDILSGHHVAVDALDQVESRKILAHACKLESIPMVYGAIAGWYGQVAVIEPGDPLLEKLYKNGQNKGAEQVLGNPSFTPALVASLQVSQVIKLLLGRGEIVKNGILHIDLLENEFEFVPL